MSSRRLNLVGLFLVSIVCILLLLTTSSHNRPTSYLSLAPYHSRFGPNAGVDGRAGTHDNVPLDWNSKRLLQKDFGQEANAGGESVQHKSPRVGPLKRIAEVLAEQRDYLQTELTGFPYPDKKPLSAFTLETGGEPIRSVVITTWRSGSTFLGDILNTLPGNFYHYEPLLDFDIIQVRGEPLASKAIGNLKSLLNCDYSTMGEYLEFGEEHTYLFKHNTRLWRQCLDHPHLCWRPRFLSPFCKLFPLQSMKVVRLRLNIAERLLEDSR